MWGGKLARYFYSARGAHRSPRVLGAALVQRLGSRTAAKLELVELARDLRTSGAASPVGHVVQRSRASSTSSRRLHHGTVKKIAPIVRGTAACALTVHCCTYSKPLTHTTCMGVASYCS